MPLFPWYFDDIPIYVRVIVIVIIYQYFRNFYDILIIGHWIYIITINSPDIGFQNSFVIHLLFLQSMLCQVTPSLYNDISSKPTYIIKICLQKTLCNNHNTLSAIKEVFKWSNQTKTGAGDQRKGFYTYGRKYSILSLSNEINQSLEYISYSNGTYNNQKLQKFEKCEF